VNFEAGEAIVTFDPRMVGVDALIAALNQADGPLSPRQYNAKVKAGPSPVSAR
jgi:hypothetical protein